MEAMVKKRLSLAYVSREQEIGKSDSIPKVLLLADIDLVVGLVVGASFAVNTLSNENRLQRRKPEHDA